LEADARLLVAMKITKTFLQKVLDVDMDKVLFFNPYKIRINVERYTECFNDAVAEHCQETLDPVTRVHLELLMVNNCPTVTTKRYEPLYIEEGAITYVPHAEK